MFRRCLRRLVDLVLNVFNGNSKGTDRKGHDRDLSTSLASANILQPPPTCNSSSSDSRDTGDLSTISIGLSSSSNVSVANKGIDELRTPLTTKQSFEEESRLKLLANYIDSPISCQNVDIECIMCLDEFSEENPMIPTLCACGESKSHFHYQCLYTWLEKSSKCPCCRTELYYQEM